MKIKITKNPTEIILLGDNGLIAKITVSNLRKYNSFVNVEGSDGGGCGAQINTSKRRRKLKWRKIK
jgi:hypothetical protein